MMVSPNQSSPQFSALAGEIWMYHTSTPDKFVISMETPSTWGAAVGDALVGATVGGGTCVAGGAVCPRGKMPYSRHTLSPNIVVGKLERCPHCGKWAIVRRATPTELAEAEERLRTDSQEGVKDFIPDEDEALRRALDESQYDD